MVCGLLSEPAAGDLGRGQSGWREGSREGRTTWFGECPWAGVGGQREVTAAGPGAWTRLQCDCVAAAVDKAPARP